MKDPYAMSIREATEGDIQRIQFIRGIVEEKILSDPALVTDEDCRIF